MTHAKQVAGLQAYDTRGFKPDGSGPRTNDLKDWHAGV